MSPRFLFLTMVALVIISLHGESPTTCQTLTPKQVDSFFRNWLARLNNCGSSAPHSSRNLIHLFHLQVMGFFPGITVRNEEVTSLVHLFCNRNPPFGIRGLKSVVKMSKVVRNSMYFQITTSGDAVEDYLFSGSMSFCDEKIREFASSYDPRQVKLVRTSGGE